MTREQYPSSPLVGQACGLAARRTGACLLAALLLQWGCAVPDRPPRRLRELPAALSSVLEEVRALSPAPGIAYYSLRAAEEPWALHLLGVDLSRCEIGLEVLPAPPREGRPAGLSTVSDLAGGAGAGAVAAVNGDFFVLEEGTTIGTEVVFGAVRHVSSRPALAWRPGSDPWMGTPATEDSVLITGWNVPRTGADGVTQVVGGFPLLLHRGKRVGDLEVASRPSFAAARHPRTAVGFDPDENMLWIVVVDGRQPEHSAGMTLPELAMALESLGATEALNLDGGGSSTMVLGRVVVNRPSDPGGERAVANALGIRFDPGLCAPEQPRRGVSGH